METFIWKLIGLAFVTAVFSLVVRQRNPEQAFLLTLAFLSVSGVYLLNEAASLFSAFLDFTEIAAENYFKVVFKAVGICLVTQMACDTCCDFGQTALAGKLELGAKIAILAISAPLFRDLLSLIELLI